MLCAHDLANFNSRQLPFLINPYSPFQKMEQWNLVLIGYREQVAKLKRTQNLAPVLHIFQKIISLAYNYQMTKFGNLMSNGSKDIFKNAHGLIY